MSTLKHKKFIQSRKRRLSGDGPAISGNLSDSSEGCPTLKPENEPNGASSPADNKQTKPQQSVRFSNTLDLIVKPYLPDQADGETLDRFHNDIWYTVRSFLTVHNFLSNRLADGQSSEVSEVMIGAIGGTHPQIHNCFSNNFLQQRDEYRAFYRDRIETVRMWRSMRSNDLNARQHLGPHFELRGLEQYQSGSVSAELNQQRAEYMEAVLRASWERRKLLQKNAPVCDNMIRESVQPLSNLSVERAQYLAAQDAREAWRKEEEDNSCKKHVDVEQSPSKRKRCMSPPESPQSILDLPFVVDGSSSSNCGEEDVLSEHDQKVKHLKQRLVHHMNNQKDAPPTPLVHGRGTVRPKKGMLMASPPTPIPMNGRRTVLSHHQELNMMGSSAPSTPMSRRRSVYSPHDMSNMSAPPTPMNGRHTVMTASMMSPGAPLAPMDSLNQRCVTTSHKKYPTTPSHLKSRRTTGMSNEDFERYMSSAQQLLDQQHDHIRRRSMSSNNMMSMPSSMGPMQQERPHINNRKASQQSHHDLLLRQDSLSMGLNHHHHHHHDQRRRASMGPMVQQNLDLTNMQNQPFLLHHQQHNDMRRRVADGSNNSMEMMQKQYEAMRRGSLGGLNDGIANLHFHNTRSNNHNEQQLQKQLPEAQLPFSEQQQGECGSSPTMMMMATTTTNNNNQ